MYNQYPNQNGYAPPPPQQQQWGAPPPQQQQQQWGAPPPQQQQQWGAPPSQQQQWGQPPPQQYGAPPQQNYGGAPPQQEWNQGPPHQQQQQQWGASPPSAPAPYQQQGYGGPPPPQNNFGPPGGPGGGPRYLGVNIAPPPPAVPINLPGYNAQFDAERIRKATKGFGTDEGTLINTLSPLDALQMEVLSRTYEQMVGRTLQKTLEKELSSWLEYTLVLLALGPLGGDIYLLHRACKGAGTHEDLLNEVLLGRSNEEIFHLKEGYRRIHGKDLVQVVRGELSQKTERMFNMAMSGQRDENPYVNHQLVQQDVEALYRAGPGKIGTDEIAICGILLSRSDAHLAAIAQAFPTRHRVSLSHMINSEFSGHMRDGLYYIAKGAEGDGQGVLRDAEMLEAAMSGMGTKDERLIYRIVRCHWNRPRFNAVKNQYQSLYRTTLRKRVEGETTGKYEKALVGIIEQN